MKGYLALGLFMLTAMACGGSEPTGPTTPAPAPSSGYAGRWSGTVLVLPLIGAGIPTIQSQPFSFTVAADQRVTDISIGYNFNGCSGAKTFSGLSIAIGASALNSQGQGWGYVSQHRLGETAQTCTPPSCPTERRPGMLHSSSSRGAAPAAATGRPRNSETLTGTTPERERHERAERSERAERWDRSAFQVGIPVQPVFVEAEEPSGAFVVDTARAHGGLDIRP